MLSNKKVMMSVGVALLIVASSLNVFAAATATAVKPLPSTEAPGLSENPVTTEGKLAQTNLRGIAKIVGLSESQIGAAARAVDKSSFLGGYINTMAAKIEALGPAANNNETRAVKDAAVMTTVPGSESAEIVYLVAAMVSVPQAKRDAAGTVLVGTSKIMETVISQAPKTSIAANTAVDEAVSANTKDHLSNVAALEDGAANLCHLGDVLSLRNAQK